METGPVPFVISRMDPYIWAQYAYGVDTVGKDVKHWKQGAFIAGMLWCLFLLHVE